MILKYTCFWTLLFINSFGEMVHTSSREEPPPLFDYAASLAKGLKPLGEIPETHKPLLQHLQSLGTVFEGEEFFTLPQKKDWFEPRTKPYVVKNREGTIVHLGIIATEKLTLGERSGEISYLYALDPTTRTLMYFTSAGKKVPFYKAPQGIPFNGQSVFGDHEALAQDILRYFSALCPSLEGTSIESVFGCGLPSCDTILKKPLKPVITPKTGHTPFIAHLRSQGPRVEEGKTFLVEEPSSKRHVTPYLVKNEEGSALYCGFAIASFHEYGPPHTDFYLINPITREVHSFSEEKGLQKPEDTFSCESPFDGGGVSENKRLLAEALKKYMRTFSSLKDVPVEQIFRKKTVLAPLQPRAFSSDMEVDLSAKRSENGGALAQASYKTPIATPKSHGPLIDYLSRKGRWMAAKPDDANYWAESWGIEQMYAAINEDDGNVTYGLVQRTAEGELNFFVGDAPEGLPIGMRNFPDMSTLPAWLHKLESSSGEEWMKAERATVLSRIIVSESPVRASATTARSATVTVETHHEKAPTDEAEDSDDESEEEESDDEDGTSEAEGESEPEKATTPSKPPQQAKKDMKDASTQTDTLPREEPDFFASLNPALYAWSPLQWTAPDDAYWFPALFIFALLHADLFDVQWAKNALAKMRLPELRNFIQRKFIPKKILNNRKAGIAANAAFSLLCTKLAQKAAEAYAGRQLPFFTWDSSAEKYFPNFNRMIVGLCTLYVAEQIGEQLFFKPLDK